MLANETNVVRDDSGPGSTLASPPVNPAFRDALDELVAVARNGHRPESEFFNPPEPWLVSHMRIFQELPQEERERILHESEGIAAEVREATARGQAASRAWPDVAFRLDSG